MADPRLAAIRAAADAAVEGPWFYNGYSAVMSEPRLKALNEWEAATPEDLPEDDPRWNDEPEVVMAKVENITWRAADGKPHGDLGTVDGERNAAFIALARTAVPDLLDLVDRLEAENQQLRDEAEQLQRQVRTAEQWMGALPHIKPARRGGI